MPTCCESTLWPSELVLNEWGCVGRQAWNFWPAQSAGLIVIVHHDQISWEILLQIYLRHTIHEKGSGIGSVAASWGVITR